MKELIILTVSKEYYSNHLDIFSNENVNIKSVYVEGENHEGDELHKKLLNNYIKAKNELRDYEYFKRHKTH